MSRLLNTSKKYIKAESLEINYTSTKKNKVSFLKICGIRGLEYIKSYTAKLDIFIISIAKFIFSFPTSPRGGGYGGSKGAYVKQSEWIER